jgi:hypothetical protein
MAVGFQARGKTPSTTSGLTLRVDESKKVIMGGSIMEGGITVGVNVNAPDVVPLRAILAAVELRMLRR